MCLGEDCVDDKPFVSRWAHKLKGYAKARWAWMKAGKPVRSPEAIEAIMAICRGCEQFEPTEDDTNGCRKCGCRRKYWIGGLRRKIEWATEECPLGKWASPKQPLQ